MVWVLRALVGAAVLLYAAWLSLPPAEALAAGATITQAWAGLAPTSQPQGSALAGVLLATIGLYGLGGVATVAGLSWAPGLFFLGFLGDIALRLAVAIGMAGAVPGALDLGARTDASLRPLGVPVETTPLAMAVLLAIGLCILATGVWRGQKGAALTRDWTRLTVWA